jgi:hypothetical protein
MCKAGRPPEALGGVAETGERRSARTVVQRIGVSSVIGGWNEDHWEVGVMNKLQRQTTHA